MVTTRRVLAPDAAPTSPLRHRGFSSPAYQQCRGRGALPSTLGVVHSFALSALLLPMSSCGF